MNDFLIVGITLLIIVILADGLRRALSSRRDKIRVSKRVYKQKVPREDKPHDELFPSELPNGGARVIAAHERTAQTRGFARPQFRGSRKPPETTTAGDEAVPILMEPIGDALMAGQDDDELEQATAVQQSAIDNDYSEERIEPIFAQMDDEQEPILSDNNERERYEEELLSVEQTTQESFDEEDYDAIDDDDQDFDDEDYHDEDDDYFDEDEPEEEPLTEDPSDPLTQKTQRSVVEPEEVFIINIMAPRNGVFAGLDLLNALMQSKLRFGDMDIFHRYSDDKGSGELLFSMANMVKPGTFDLDAMDQFETPGISLFMTLPINFDSMQSFELMVDTARDIADALNGELKDADRSVMTKQTIEHNKERIRDFERRRLFSRQR